MKTLTTFPQKDASGNKSPKSRVFIHATQRASSPKGVRGNKSPTSHIFHYEIAACRSCCAGTLTIEEWKTEMLAEAVSVNSSETAKRNVWRDRSTSRVYSTECTLKQQ